MLFLLACVACAGSRPAERARTTTATAATSIRADGALVIQLTVGETVLAVDWEISADDRVLARGRADGLTITVPPGAAARVLAADAPLLDAVLHARDRAIRLTPLLLQRD